ncbi:hypothetical protein GIB67_026678, partial [Kingdonia uniflora]
MRHVGFLNCEQFVIGEERETYGSYWAKQTSEVGHLLTDSQRMGNIDLFGPTAVRAESARDAQRLQELTDENATLRRHLDSVDDQLYAHDLHLSRGRDVRVVLLPLGGGARSKRNTARCSFYRQIPYFQDPYLLPLLHFSLLHFSLPLETCSPS